MKNLFVISLILCVSFGMMYAQNPVSNIQVKKIEVTGSAEMEVVPDEIYVSITLQEYYNKQKAKVAIDEISKTFLSTCQGAGIAKDRIEVQEMSGADNSNWWSRKHRREQPDLMQQTGYVIKFSSPAEVDKLVNLLDDNATQNVYVSKVSNSKQAEYRKQLKTQALQNAKAKAQYLLEGIGEKLGGVIYVHEVEQEMSVPRYSQTNFAFSNSLAADEGGSPNEGINFKKIKYRYEMEAHFAIQ